MSASTLLDGHLHPWSPCYARVPLLEIMLGSEECGSAHKLSRGTVGSGALRAALGALMHMLYTTLRASKLSFEILRPLHSTSVTAHRDCNGTTLPVEHSGIVAGRTAPSKQGSRSIPAQGASSYIASTAMS